VGAAAPSSGVTVTMVRPRAGSEFCGRLAWRPAQPARRRGQGQRPGHRGKRGASRVSRWARAAPGPSSGRVSRWEWRSALGPVAAGGRHPRRSAPVLRPGRGARPRRLGVRWGGRRASLPSGSSLAWAWATAVRPARFMAARVAPMMRVRASLDMVASDRSTDAVWAMGWLLGGDGWPAGQLPPATGRPRSTPTPRRASAEPQPRMGGLLSPFGDALLGQDLAQPGMLVVHVRSPSCSSACWFQRPRSAVVVAGQLRMAPQRAPPNPAPAPHERSPVPHLWPLAPYGRRFAPAGRAG
jgi:hypothetical protein